ncbi:plexin domain-containing protein 2-like isoform X2 [Mytilus californianus]|uniref:plexin domain-containing protein 2-like isoform X2 n=1 Tax=Mytilus californianus TaxID=6549 RepID=UPI0022452244|nr:plexin domain-containing protein 2-like isoform X2 [Mytilus californianus]
MAMTEQVPLQVFIYVGIIICSLVDFIKTEDVPYTLLNEPSNFNPVISFEGHYINKRQAPSSSDTTSPITETTPSPSGTQSTQSSTTLSTIDVKDQGSHKYYTSKVVLSDKYWDELNDFPAQHASLTNGHRIAVTVGLTFGFPFYGHSVRKVTIATGGFLYMSPFLHSWLTATQYIAPLMANFDTTIGNGSDILYKDYTDRFVVEWRDVYLQDQNHTNPFSFQTTLHKNGSIVFGYRQVPINVTEIITANHPVKIGVSDAFYVDATVNGITRRTIYEYHRVEVNLTLIEENTVVLLEPLLTCNIANDCETCIQQNSNFECKWCAAISRCSDGIDWHRQEWMKAGCTSLASEKCAKSPPTTLSTRTTNKSTITITSTTTVATTLTTVSTKPTSTSLKHSPLPRTTSSVASSEQVAAICDSSSISSGKGSCNEMKKEKNTQQAVGGIIGIVLVLLILIVAIVGWFVYAYRNPTSASGMWLMEHRPSVMKQKIVNMKFWKRTTETGDKYKIESSASEA